MRQYSFRWSHLEAWFWISSILALALSNPYGEKHYSLCLFHYLGFDFCPGCGLGHSIALLFRLKFIESFQTHPLGAFAVIILIKRSYTILFKSNKIPNTINYEQNSTVST
ncbi:MAG: DUF2752 domain-containing protein [Marinilabiliaceae bacterium]|nr:DUF2752 domain-containing protein [Marinilabiliaceae bacterium]